MTEKEISKRLKEAVEKSLRDYIGPIMDEVNVDSFEAVIAFENGHYLFSIKEIKETLENPG